jgi:hypothetical protein
MRFVDRGLHQLMKRINIAEPVHFGFEPPAKKAFG